MSMQVSTLYRHLPKNLDASCVYLEGEVPGRTNWAGSVGKCFLKIEVFHDLHLSPKKGVFVSCKVRPVIKKSEYISPETRC